MVDKILRILDEKGMTQGALESAACLPRNRISRWKAGTGEPTASQAMAIARALDVSVEFLVNDDAKAPVPDSSREMAEILWLVGKVGYDVAVRRLTLSPDVLSPAPTYAELAQKERPPRVNGPSGGRKRGG